MDFESAYRPPRSDPAAPAGERPPWGVHVVALLCALQFAWPVLRSAALAFDGSGPVKFPVDSILGQALFHGVLLAGGISLFRMQRRALTFMVVFFAWAAVKSYVAYLSGGDFPLTDLAIALGCFGYAFVLQAKGRLR